MRRNNPLAFLAAIFSVTVLAWTMGYAKPPENLVSAPDFSSAFLKLDVRGALRLALLPAIVLAGAILLPVVAIGRLFGVGHGCGGCRRRSGDAPSAA